MIKLFRNDFAVTVLFSVLAFSLSVHLVLSAKEERKLPQDYSIVDNDIAQIKQRIEKAKHAKPAPPLYQSWVKAEAVADAVGLEVLLLSGKDEQGAIRYKGNMGNWSALVKGKTMDVLAVALVINEIAPVIFYDINAEKGKAALSFTILGSN